MKAVILYSLLIIVTVQFAVSRRRSGTSRRIIGGAKAHLGQFPFIAKFRPTTFDFVACGASIISPTILLTAAHCLCLDGERYTDLYAEVGTVETYKRKGKLYKLRNAICHANWVYIQEINKSTDDIALARIDGEIKFTPYVQPIRISNAIVPNGQLVTVIGYGCTTFADKNGARFLMYVMSKKISNKACLKTYDYMDKTLMCTYTQGHGICFGDSGSPVVYNNELVGIAINTNETDNPDLHMSVKPYIPWIKHTIKLLQ